jgi:hypothetical protein
MTRSSGDAAAPGRDRPGDALTLWATLASFGILVGVLALARNLERDGAGRRWRRADANGGDVDALLADDGLKEAG